MQKRRIKGLSLIALSISLAISLSGCTNNIKETKADLKQAITHADNYKQVLSGPNTATTLTTSIPYLGSKSFKISNKVPLPPVFSLIAHHHSGGRMISFTDVVKMISEDTGLQVHVSESAIRALSLINDEHKKTTVMPELPNKAGAEPALANVLGNAMLAVNFDGTVKQMLNQFTNKYGLYWQYDSNTHTINIFETTTKIFYFNLLPGATKTQSSIAATGDDNASKITYNTSISSAWQSALKNIKSMNSNSPMLVSGNETYGMVTVTATPPVLKRIGLYVKSLNTQSNESVMVKIAVYDVRVGNSTNYGLNWDGIYHYTKGSIAWENKNIVNSLPLNNSAITSTATATATFKKGAFAGSNLVASALQKANKAAYVTGANFATQNGIPYASSNVTNQTYLRNVKTTPLGVGITGNENVQVSTEQATLQTGTILDITPFIIPDTDQVRLHMSINMSFLESMDVQKLGSDKNPTMIQSPTTTTQKSIQTFLLKSGDTEVISGFTRDVWGTGTNSIGPLRLWALGGAQSTQNEKVMTVILATPYIIKH